MTRREIREKSLQSMIEAMRVQGDALVPRIYWFEHGFDAAWDAMVDEIRLLVADLLEIHELKRGGVVVRCRHNATVKRLRELVREGE